MQGTIIYDPLLPWPILVLAMVIIGAALGFALWRRLTGWWLRGFAALTILAALVNPSWQSEDREPINNVVLLLVDRTASQGISDRPEQVNETVQSLQSRLEARPNTILKTIELPDAPDGTGTLLMTELSKALAEIPQNQIAGVIVISDGQVHDLSLTPEVPAPVHLLQTGHREDWDRRLILTNGPSFGILGEPVVLSVRIEDQGQVPETAPPTADLVISLDGGPTQSVTVPVGRDIDLPLTLDHGGINVVQLQIAPLDGELTDQNNTAVLQINGVRDRLSVLLVSGEPYPGERTWRNLLKSDSSVDLVHFTILRPPQKQDQAPVSELALIAFPTRELFLDKIYDFDLIIFDRYRRRGILPAVYLENVRQYVENGGAVLVAAGPGFASADSLYRSPLGAIIPAAPTSRLIEQGYQPGLSEIGQRHPVTAGLGTTNTQSTDTPDWGRWFRLVEVEEDRGNTLMTGPGDRPLLILDRVGEGRVALLASDHAWLWGRGFEGGGPQQELLRRLAHWMMKEPELEEESLRATSQGLSMKITRRTLEEGPRSVEIINPDGESVMLDMSEQAPGRYTATYDAPDVGLYRLAQGDQEAVIALGPTAPKEFEETIASATKMQPIVDAQRGGVFAIEDGIPDIRSVRPGRLAAGRGWMGLPDRQAYVTTDVRLMSLLPAWAALILAALFSVAAWLLEGRRS